MEPVGWQLRGDSRAIDALTEAMKDGAVKRHAIASLGMIGDPRALPAVLDALKGKGIKQEGTPTPGCIVSEDAFIKEAAATALGQFRDPLVIPDLIMLLKDGVLQLTVPKTKKVERKTISIETE